jgi:GAF domain-containing protein
MKFPEILKKIFPARSADKQASSADRGLVLASLGIVLIGVIVILGFNLVTNPSNRGVIFGLGILVAASLVLAFFNFHTPGRFIVPTTTYLAVTAVIARNGIRDEAIIGYAAALVLSSLLLGKWGTYAFGTLITLTVAFVGYRESIGQIASNLEAVGLEDTLTMATIFLATSLVLGLVITRLENALRASRKNEQDLSSANRELITLKEELESRVDQRTSQLQAVIEIGRAANASLDPEELIERIVNLITDRLGYYYTALFLVDASGNWAELKNATGAAGRILLQNRHRLEIGSKSMVGTAISMRKPRVALDVGDEAVRFNNPLLPETHSEIALPLIAGDQVLGALDVQSTQVAAFGPQDIETLQGMANQVAIGLENARLYQQAQQNIVEMSAVYRQYLSENWSAISKRERLEYEVGLTEPQEGNNVINIPLSLRETAIGNIVIESEGALSSEEQSIIEAIATQAALALENARLLDETQQVALRERTTAEITGKIWSATSLDAILQTAVKELGQALNATEGIIELKVE